jgi:hypothetical protein
MLAPLLYFYWVMYHKTLNWLYNVIPVPNRYMLRVVLSIAKARHNAETLRKTDWDKVTQYKN